MLPTLKPQWCCFSTLYSTVVKVWNSGQTSEFTLLSRFEPDWWQILPFMKKWSYFQAFRSTHLPTTVQFLFQGSCSSVLRIYSLISLICVHRKILWLSSEGLCSFIATQKPQPNWLIQKIELILFSILYSQSWEPFLSVRWGDDIYPWWK